MAENVYDAIKNHDSEKLKEQFCERLQPGKETAVDKIYEYIDGEIEVRYKIGAKGDIINTIEPKDQGLQVLRVYKQNEDGTWNYSKGYLQIGSELD